MLSLILNRSHFFLALVILLVVFTHTATAQSTGFTYQGRLNDNNQVADGNYDFEFKLFDTLSDGTQVGTSREVLNVVVSNGVFTVLVDFGAGAFPGADRFLEIGVRPAGGEAFTTLTPRQQVTITPYAIKAASATSADLAINANDAQNALNATNATQLGGVAANQYVQTNDSRLSDARNPLPNSRNYVQNTNDLQALSNFNISGTGTARVLSAETSFNIGTSPVLRSPGNSNIFVGQRTGFSIASSGEANSFFGVGAGTLNFLGNNNAFFGFEAGHRNREGNNNSFVGKEAGRLNTEGSSNSFFGTEAGETNTTGSNNTIIGSRADVSMNSLTNSTAIGHRAFVESSNALVLGSVNGKNGATEDTQIGIGTTQPSAPLDIERDTAFSNHNPMLQITEHIDHELYGYGPIIRVRSSHGTRSVPEATKALDNLLTIEVVGHTGSEFDTPGNASIVFVAPSSWTSNSRPTEIELSTTGVNTAFSRRRVVIQEDGNVAIGDPFFSVSDKLDVDGNIRIGTTGGTSGCVKDRDATVIAGTCSSDLRFKRNITSFSNTLNNFSKLRPVNFFWRADEFAGKHFGTGQSFGLIAQEVEQIFPELVATDEQGFKVVNYSKLPLLTIQAVKELKVENDALKSQLQGQQTQFVKQLAAQQTQLSRQQQEMEALKRLVCHSHAGAEVCK